jgi:hypothetical protein
VLTDYALNGRASTRRAKQALAHLERFFGTYRAGKISAALVIDYQKTRLENGAKPATINLECSMLNKAFTLAMRQQNILVKPYIGRLVMNNVRQGFLESEQIDQNVDRLPQNLKAHIRTAA